MAQYRMQAADDAADDHRTSGPSETASQAAARLRAEATACTIRATLAQHDADAMVLAQECAHDAVASRVRSTFSPPDDDLHSCRRSLQPTTDWCSTSMAHVDHCADCQRAWDSHLTAALDSALATDQDIWDAARRAGAAAAALAAVREREADALRAAARAERAAARCPDDTLAPPAEWLPDTAARLRECISRGGTRRPYLSSLAAARAAGLLYRAKHQLQLDNADRQNVRQLQQGLHQRLDSWQLRFANHTAKMARRRARFRQLLKEKHKTPPWAPDARPGGAQRPPHRDPAAAVRRGVPARVRHDARTRRHDHAHRNDRRGAAEKMARSDLRAAGYNMSRLTKIQLQCLDLLDIDVIGLTEVWSTAANLDDYRGANRLLVGDPPTAGDPAGAVAARLSASAARALHSWDMVPGARSRAMWMQFATVRGPVVIVVAYVPPHYRKAPDQQTVLDAVSRFTTSWGTYPVIVIGDWNAQLVRHTDVSGRWVLRKDWTGMNPAQTAASKRLHGFATAAGLYAVNTGQWAFQPQRGFAASWKLPGLGSDGLEKLVTLDYTFANEAAKDLVLSCCNIWAQSKLRWAAARFDHALQLSTWRMQTAAIKSVPGMRGVKAVYRPQDRKQALEDNFRRLIAESESATVAALTQIRDDDPRNAEAICLARRNDDLDAMMLPGPDGRRGFILDGCSWFGQDSFKDRNNGRENFISYLRRCAGWLAVEKTKARLLFLASIQSTVSVTYRAVVDGLQAAHEPIAREAARADRPAAGGGGRGPGAGPSASTGSAAADSSAPMMTRSHGLEWPAGAETRAILAERVKAATDANRTLRRVPLWHRSQLTKRLKASTLADARTYIDDEVKVFCRLRNDPAAYHAQWAKMAKHGRRGGGGGGRFFHGRDGDSARTVQEDANKWAAYQAERYQATPEECALPGWERLLDTTIPCTAAGRVCTQEGCTGVCPLLSDRIANLVLDAAKEGRTPGLDRTPVTLFLCSPTARKYVVVILQIMWRYETLPDKIAHMLQIMIHKTGRTRDERKSYRPITLMCDLLKIFDLALYYKLGRETGTIREPMEGATTLRESFLSSTQRAFRRRHSTLDLLLIQSLTYLRIQACDMLAVSCQTDLKGAFDTISHKMTDRALKAAGASDKCRNLFRMIYSSVKCQVRCRGAGGGEADSFAYDQDRGGAQGSVLMPLLFVLLMHHVYLQCDSGHAAIYGAGEAQIERTMARCKLCAKLYKWWDYIANDGHCRGCQIVRAQPEGGCVGANDDDAEPGAVRRSMTRAAADALRPQPEPLVAPLAPLAFADHLTALLDNRVPGEPLGLERTLADEMSTASMHELQTFVRQWGNMRVVAVDADAHCQFEAVSRHVQSHSAITLRDEAAQWLMAHGQTTVRLLHQPRPVNLMEAAYIDNEDDWLHYCERVHCETAAMRANPLWGDHVTLIAMAALLERPIRVWLATPTGPPRHAIFALADLPPGPAMDYVNIVHAMDRLYMATQPVGEVTVVSTGDAVPAEPTLPHGAAAGRPATRGARITEAGDSDDGARAPKSQDVKRSPSRWSAAAAAAPKATPRRPRGNPILLDSDNSDSDDGAPGGAADGSRADGQTGGADEPAAASAAASAGEPARAPTGADGASRATNVGLPDPA
jgi:hypothetical protein